MNKTWLILDTPYLCHRAKHSTPELQHEGMSTGILYGVLRDILTLQQQFQTKHIVFCWDYGFGLRKTLNINYKANRVPSTDPVTVEFETEFREQMNKLRQRYLPKIGFRNVFYQKGYEADDIIASICHKLPKDEYGVIVSGDHDMYQLLSPNISIYKPGKGTYTARNFKREFGIPAKHWVYVKALAGCSSDNVKGIQGVGEKTAIKYMKKQLNRTHKVYARIKAEKDAMLKTNVPLVRLPYKGVDTFKLRDDKVTQKGWDNVCDALGMKSLRDKHAKRKVKGDAPLM